MILILINFLIFPCNKVMKHSLSLQSSFSLFFFFCIYLYDFLLKTDQDKNLITTIIHLLFIIIIYLYLKELIILNRDIYFVAQPRGSLTSLLIIFIVVVYISCIYHCTYRYILSYHLRYII